MFVITSQIEACCAILLGSCYDFLKRRGRVHRWHGKHDLKKFYDCCPQQKMGFPIYMSIFQSLGMHVHSTRKLGMFRWNRTQNLRLPFRNLGRWNQGSCFALVTAIYIKSGIFYKKRSETQGVNLRVPQKPMARLVGQSGAAAYTLHHSVPWNLTWDHQPAIKDESCQYEQTCPLRSHVM